MRISMQIKKNKLINLLIGCQFMFDKYGWMLFFTNIQKRKVKKNKN